MANYLVDFRLELYTSRIVKGVDSAEEALRVANEMIDSDEGFASLVRSWDDPSQTDWIQDNADVDMYSEIADEDLHWFEDREVVEACDWDGRDA